MQQISGAYLPKQFNLGCFQYFAIIIGQPQSSKILYQTTSKINHYNTSYNQSYKRFTSPQQHYFTLGTIPYLNRNSYSILPYLVFVKQHQSAGNNVKLFQKNTIKLFVGLFRNNLMSSISSKDKKDLQNITIDLRDQFETKAQNILPVLIKPPTERQVRQSQMILNLIKKVQIIHKTFDFKSNEFKSLIDHLKVQIFQEKAVVFKKGEEGHYFYIVLIGCCAVKPEAKTEENTNTKPEIFYHPGKGFGQISLIYDVPRGATVVAYQNTTLVKISRQYFKKCMKKQKKLNQMNSYFEEHPFLQMADSFLLRIFASSSIKIPFKQGDIIIKQGDEVNFLLFFIKGCVSVSKRIQFKLRNGKVMEQLMQIQQLSENGIFGEQFMVSKKPSSYIVKALDRGEYAKVQLQHNIETGDTPFQRRIMSPSNRSISQQQILDSHRCNLYKQVRKMELLMSIYKNKNQIQELQKKLKLAKIKYREIQDATLMVRKNEQELT